MGKTSRFAVLARCVEQMTSSGKDNTATSVRFITQLKELPVESLSHCSIIVISYVSGQGIKIMNVYGTSRSCNE